MVFLVPTPRASLICQNKYLSRLAQSRIVPDAVPSFWPIDVAEHAPLPDGLVFPAFVKPMKSFFSIGAQRIETSAELREVKRKWAELDAFFMPLDRLLRRHVGVEIGTTRLIAEGLLKGVQVTVEGYAYGGDVHVLGVVDSIFFPDTLAFSRFDYPSALPEAVQERMADIAKRLMSGLGFDNGMFNVEMMYDAREDRIAIIEINPRMASQFADLYEKVDGTNAYEVLLDLGSGIRAVAETAARQISLRCELCHADLRGWRGRGTYLARKGSPRSNVPILISGSRSTPRLGGNSPTSSRTERASATASSASADATGWTCCPASRTCQAELGIVLLPVEAKREVAAPVRFAALEIGVEADA